MLGKPLQYFTTAQQDTLARGGVHPDGAEEPVCERVSLAQGQEDVRLTCSQVSRCVSGVATRKVKSHHASFWQIPI